MRRTVVKQMPAKRTPTRPRVRPIPNIEVEIDEDIDDQVAADATEYAGEKIGSVAKDTSRPLRHIRIRITGAPRSAGRFVIAHAHVDCAGEPVLAHTVAATPREAVDLLRDKLRAQLIRTRPLWRRKTVADSPNRTFVVRCRSTLPGRLSLDQAVRELAALGQDFCLFTEESSLQDSALHRLSSGGYRLTQVSPRPNATGPVGTDVELDERAAPAMTEAEAIAVLEATGARFVFFRDRVRGRGHLLYRREDGNFGLIIPTG
jgi:hypothetical protein